MTNNVMAAAWADYRRDLRQGLILGGRAQPFNREHFAYCLRQAWAIARARAAAAERYAQRLREVEAMLASPAPAVDPRVAQIDADMRAMEMAKFIDWPAYNALLAERERIAA